MKESKTAYAYLIEHMQEPSFLKVWDVAYDFIRKLPSELCDELHESLNRGVDVLDSEPLLQMYIYAFGKMHNAKLQHAFNQLQNRVILNDQIKIVDYGCGQGLASICYHDFIKEHNPRQRIKKVTLIEPSSLALSRAELLCSRFYPDAEIIAVNKSFDDLTVDDIAVSSEVPTLHLFSNILDVEFYNLNHLIQIVKNLPSIKNEYVIVSPIQNTTRTQRLKTFAFNLGLYIYYENYLDKRQLDEERDWTCAVLLCSDITKKEIIAHECEKVFEDAKTYFDTIEKDSNCEYNKELFNKLQACAELGDKRCQNMLGIWYKKGVGFEPNYHLAHEWFMKSADQKYPSALYNLGSMYYDGEGVEQDFHKAVEFYTIGADNNDSDCQFQLGICYYYGTGVEKDYHTAFQWFKKAADQGHDEATYYLWKCYQNGYGTEKDDNYALKVLKEAVKLKHPESCYTLATYYHSGEFVNKNERESFSLIKKSAELGYCLAQEKLGEIYRKGALGEDESPQRSFKWYLKAAEQGNTSAQFYIGYYYANGYGVKKDDNLAFEWYSKAAEYNNPAALNNLAICYEYGRGTNIDLIKAVYYYEESAKLGNITAQKNLATCYKNGTGVKSDPCKEYYWTLEAAKQGDIASQRKVALYCFKGFGTDRNQREAMIWYARYYSKANQINSVTDAFCFFKEKANDGDVQSLYMIGKCLQYGVATDKNIEKANVYFKKAAELGHIESLIKVRHVSSIYKYCSFKDDEQSFKTANGATYSKDKKVFINSGYQNRKVYKIANGTRVICDNAFHNASIETVIIPSSVLAIGKNPFAGYSIREGRSVETIVNNSCYFIVSDSALYTRDKKKLISYFGENSKFTIPKGVEIIGERAFADRYNLVEIVFPDSLCCIEDEAFLYCTRLNKINLPSSVTTIGARCFYGCTNLSEVQFLGTISIIKEETFMGCNITKLTLPKSLVEIGNNAFNSNSKLEDIVLPDSVRILGDSCFAYCGIRNLSLDCNLQKIGDFCFFKCPVEKLSIPSQVISIGINPFIGTKHIECVGNRKYVSENGILYDKETGGAIAHYEDAEIALYPPISRVNSFAFYNSSVTDVFMGANIVEIEPWAFYRAEKLEKVVWKKCKIKEIPEGCFGKCTSLYKITIPASVEVVQQGSFFDCYELRKIRFEGERTKANEEMFKRIERSIDIPDEYSEPDDFMGSTISVSFKRENLDFNSFTKVEINIPYGCSNIFKFAAIYDEDIHNQHSTYGYGMDRDFIVKEDEKE